MDKALPFYSPSALELRKWTALIQIKLGNIDLAQEQLEGYSEEVLGTVIAAAPRINIFTVMALEAYVIQYKGDSARAENMFHQILKKIEESINPKYPIRSNILAGCYASLGMHEKALSELRNGAGTGTFSYYYLSILPLLDPIRHLPEYKEIMNNLKTKSDRMKENVIAMGYFDEELK